ncbi:MAG: glycosyl hydrolase [Sphingomonadaceae bacterium]
MPDDNDLRLQSSGIELDRRLLLKGSASVILSAAGSGAGWARANADLSTSPLIEAFDNPPPEAGVGVYWYWLVGAVTREGITADLEAMHANGVTRAMMFAIGKSSDPPLVSPPADALTPQWWAMVEHAVAEADRLGISVAMNMCDGWATASGPWITPDISMQVVTWSEARLEAGQAAAVLPRPPSLHDYYRDTAVLAFLWPEDLDRNSAELRPRVSSDLPIVADQLSAILDPANDTEICDTTQEGYFQFTFDEPFTLRSVTVRTPSPWGYSPGVYRAANSFEILASDDGDHFRHAGWLEYPQHGWQTDLTTLTHAVPETTARFFRFVHHPEQPGPYYENYDFGQDVRLRLFSLQLSAQPVIHQIVGKTARQWSISRRTTSADAPDAVCVRPDQIIDLTDRLRHDGTLDWMPEKGRWRILRIGSTTNGHENSAAGGAQGLEVDRFNRDAVKLQFDSWFGKALERVGPERAGKVLHTVHVDSWEASGQNWSSNLPAAFEKARGYSLQPWLATLAAVPVASARQSEQVLFDFRNTIAELTQSEFFDTVADLAHEKGCTFSAEPASPTYAVDGLRWAKAADLPMGEFWLRTPRNDKPTDVADAVSGGRTYGKQIIATESFTENNILWDEHPFMLKPLGDAHYCRGINRFMLHVYTAQPFMDRAPGMTLSGIGTFFTRNQTWWHQAQPWFDYMRRCQALLQLGTPVSDVAVFIGEDIPSRALLPHQLDNPLPQGVRYDSINKEVLTERVSIRGGHIVVGEGGVSYRVLWLPDRQRYSTAFLETLTRLVEQGATVLGAPPIGTIGNETFAEQRHRKSVVARLWGNRETIGDRSIGAGRIVWGITMAALLDRIGIEPDLHVEAPDEIDWTHREGPDWGIYFVTNRQDISREFELSLRSTKGEPEIWDADTTVRRPAPVWHRVGKRTHVRLKLDPYGSAFVVLKATGKHDHVVAKTPDSSSMELVSLAQGTAIEAATAGTVTVQTAFGHRFKVSAPDIPEPIQVGDRWSLDFSGFGAPSGKVELDRPKLWSALSAPKYRFHSGSGRYATQFHMSVERMAAPLRVMLDLGTAHEIVEIRVNDRDVARLWRPPFSVDVTDFLQPGTNTLEVIVTNTWRNRLIGDAALSEAERVAWVHPKLRGKKPWLPEASDPLLPSGLAGPVKLLWRRMILLRGL